MMLDSPSTETLRPSLTDIRDTIIKLRNKTSPAWPLMDRAAELLEWFAAHPEDTEKRLIEVESRLKRARSVHRPNCICAMCEVLDGKYDPQPTTERDTPQSARCAYCDTEEECRKASMCLGSLGSPAAPS